jgi:hypothetical protein
MKNDFNLTRLEDHKEYIAAKKLGAEDVHE